MWLAVILFVIIVLVTGWRKVLDVRNEFGAAMRARINIAASLLDRTIFQHDSHVEELIALAEKEPLIELLTSRFENLHVYSEKDHFFVLDSHGRIILISAPFSSYKDLDFSTALFQTKENKRSVFHHQSLLTKQPVVSILYPLPDGLRLIIEESIDNIVAAMSHFEAGRIYNNEIFFLLSASGQVVYHPDRELVKSRHPLGFEMKERTAADDDGLFSYRYHGVDYLASCLDFPSLPDWTLCCAVPRAEMISSVKETVTSQILMLMLLFILFFIFLQTALNRFSPSRSAESLLRFKIPLTPSLRFLLRNGSRKSRNST